MIKEYRTIAGVSVIAHGDRQAIHGRSYQQEIKPVQQPAKAPGVGQVDRAKSKSDRHQGRLFGDGFGLVGKIVCMKKTGRFDDAKDKIGQEYPIGKGGPQGMERLVQQGAEQKQHNAHAVGVEPRKKGSKEDGNEGKKI